MTYPLEIRTVRVWVGTVRIDVLFSGVFGFSFKDAGKPASVAVRP